jgi:anti-anti-sigma factor
MQITTNETDHWLEMRVEGRFDNDWAGHVNEAIDEALRRGSHTVVMDLSGVSFLSSAGLGSLVRAHKHFKEIRGFFGVADTTPHVEEVIRLTGLANMLLCDREKVRQSLPSSQTTLLPSHRIAAPAGMEFEIYDLEPQARLSCRCYGDPQPLLDGGYGERQCRSVKFPTDTIGLGLGALGRGFADCQGAFGEFLAVGGGAAHQPTRDAARPDYQFGTGNFIPQVQTLYGLSCRGDFAQLIRFEPDHDSPHVQFSALVEQCLVHSHTNLAGMVFIAESAGLVSAKLRRSPAGEAANGHGRFAHPEIRRWLSFTPEHAFSHTLALVTGIASRGIPTGHAAALAPLLRPLGPKSEVLGHFHAAVFSYRPLKKRSLDLATTIKTLFESEDLQAVLHLLHDDREIIGGGESLFTGGACWIGPIGDVASEGGALI